jgi:peptidyl-prolyl cis-trans isomerase SurA
MKMLRPFLVLAVLVATPVAAQQPKKLASSGTGKRITIERVVAVVNDTVILESELTQRSRPMMAELDKVEDPRERQRQQRTQTRQVLGSLVDEELILQAATEAKLEVTEPEIQKALDEVKRQNKVTDAQLVEALRMQGYTIEEYRKDVRRQILRLRAINVLVRPRVAVTDDEVKEQYEKMIGKSSSVTEVHVRHILVKLPDRPSEDQMNAGRRRAGELVARARAGEDFVELSKANSDDPRTKAAGGDLGWLKRGELPTEWEEILFAMGEGEVRGPVRGPQGLHVFQLVEAKKEALRSFNEVKEQLRNQIYSEEMEKQTKVWLEELHKRAHVEIKL